MSKNPMCPCGGALTKRMWETDTGLCRSEIYCSSCGSDTPVDGFPIEFEASQSSEPTTDDLTVQSPEAPVEHDDEREEIAPL